MTPARWWKLKRPARPKPGHVVYRALADAMGKPVRKPLVPAKPGGGS